MLLVGYSETVVDELASKLHPDAVYKCYVQVIDSPWNPASWRRTMKATYDIFKKLPTGSPIWVEAVQGLEFARARLAKLMQADPGDYLVYDLTNAKIVESLTGPA
jgi:hypothetical protein